MYKYILNHVGIRLTGKICIVILNLNMLYYINILYIVIKLIELNTSSLQLFN
jgi:ubiquitin-protein ligase